MRTTLFPGDASPLNQIVRIEGIEFTVIGVQERLGSAFGRDQDNSVYIPITAFNRMYGPGTGFALFGRPRPGSGLDLMARSMKPASSSAPASTRAPASPIISTTLTPDAIRGFIDQVLGMIAAIVVPVTCISLVVGGIVIMNIMLVSVTERTREIGIRKAIGARHGDVMMQILIEAVVLASVGGAMGVAAGAAGHRPARPHLRNFPAHHRWPTWLLSLVVSSVVGVVSGWYPASRAAKLDPVVALRAE